MVEGKSGTLSSYWYTHKQLPCSFSLKASRNTNNTNFMLILKELSILVCVHFKLYVFCEITLKTKTDWKVLEKTEQTQGASINKTKPQHLWFSFSTKSKLWAVELSTLHAQLAFFKLLWSCFLHAAPCSVV